MTRIAVCVVDAQTPGNVGTIARAMKNFGFSDLLLVDPPELGPGTEAYGFAGRARHDVLADAERVTFDELVEHYHTVGFTSTTNEDCTKHIRYPFRTPAELAADLETVDTDTALVFGRERIGLTNEELGRLDELCSIPASPDYPVLNLGQAATIALYECRDLVLEETQLPDTAIDRASEVEIEAFYEHADEYLDLIDFPPERRPKTEQMIRRILGRAHPTGREIATLHGILQRSEYHIQRADDRPRSENEKAENR